MVIINNMEELEAYCRSVTSKVRGETSAETDKELSPFAKKLVSIIDKSDFGSYKKSIQELFSVLIEEKTGEKVAFSLDGTYTYPLFSIIVPETNPNGHSYPIGKPFLVRSKSSSGNAEAGLRIEGDTGNTHGGKWRYATDDEITEFFRDMSSSTRRYITSRMLTQ